MEDILKSVNEAEEKAAEIKLGAEEKAAQILADAEKKAAELLKTSEEKLKIYREEQLKSAEDTAKRDYEKVVAENAEKAKKYADSLIEKTEIQVGKVVGRVSRGNC